MPFDPRVTWANLICLQGHLFVWHVSSMKIQTKKNRQKAFPNEKLIHTGQVFV